MHMERYAAQGKPECATPEYVSEHDKLEDAIEKAAFYIDGLVKVGPRSAAREGVDRVGGA